MKKLSISKKRVKNITFTTVKKGKADLKKDGGTVRGRHIVRVTMMVGNDYKTIAGIDLNKMKSSSYMDHYESVKERTGLDFSTLDFGCAWMSRSLREGLEQSHNGENDYSSYLETYNPHPSGVRGVLVHKETGNLYIMGVVVEEKIIQHDPKGNARETKKSKNATIVRGIKEELGLLSGKWRMYELAKDTTINGLGVEDKIKKTKMSTIDRVEKSLRGSRFASSQFETVGSFFIHLCYKYEAEKAGAICEWAVSHLANDGYVTKGSLQTLAEILSKDNLSDIDREYAEIVKEAILSCDFGLSRTPKHWHKTRLIGL
jgi:hypothetical protein